MKIIYRLHSLSRMSERHINQNDIRQVLETGEIIEDYPNDYPYPSRLILGYVNKRPIHVVSAYYSEEDANIIVTVYEPDSDKWTSDFRSRK